MLILLMLTKVLSSSDLLEGSVLTQWTDAHCGLTPPRNWSKESSRPLLPGGGPKIPFCGPQVSRTYWARPFQMKG